MNFSTVGASAVLALCALAFQGPARATTQQEKMTACNKSANGKKGDERKAYMKDCLSAKG